MGIVTIMEIYLFVNFVKFITIFNVSKILFKLYLHWQLNETPGVVIFFGKTCVELEINQGQTKHLDCERKR